MEFLLNIAANLLSSILFLFFILWFLKPKIRIAPFVCKNQSPYPNEGEMFFIKFVNCSLFAAYDVKAELIKVERFTTPPNAVINRRLTTLTLKKSTLMHVPHYMPRWARKDAKHAMILRTADNLDIILGAENQSVQLLVTLKHGLTGLTKLYTVEYSDLSEIKQAKFSNGTKFGIM